MTSVVRTIWTTGSESTFTSAPPSLHPGKTAFCYEGFTQVHMETLPESNATAMEIETILSYEAKEATGSPSPTIYQSRFSKNLI